MARQQFENEEYTTDNPTPAQQLVGKELANGWKVEKLTNRPETATGGYFSTSYIVSSSNGEKAFLKAMDYRKALEAPDPARELQLMTAAYNFERAVLEKCKSNSLSRIVRVLDSGTLPPEDGDASSVVQYLIFELADHDIRSLVNWRQALETAWTLRIIQQATASLQQLHSVGIAHQDVKPSNVLIFKNIHSKSAALPESDVRIFEDSHSKLADLGRAFDRNSPSPHDEFPCAGDRTYAPLELLYGYVPQDWRVRRLGGDLYLLGSLVVFFCAGISMTHLLFNRISEEHRWTNWGGTYNEVLPHLQHAFTQIIRELREGMIHSYFADDIAEIVRQLCNPDPDLRGHPKTIKYGSSKYSLERYVSKFDLLAKKAKWSLTRRDPIRRAN